MHIVEMFSVVSGIMEILLVLVGIVTIKFGKPEEKKGIGKNGH